MKLTIASTTLFNLLMMLSTTTNTTTCSANEVVKYMYKEKSNQAYIASYWQIDACIDISSFSMFASDGYVKQAGSKKILTKALSGSATYYTNCKSTGATRNELNFDSTDSVTGLTFASLTNVTIKTNITAFFSKTRCTMSAVETVWYYVCGDEFDSGTRTLLIDTVMTLPEPGVPSSEYTSYNKGVNRGMGYITKYESKSRCKSTFSIKNKIKLGKTPPFGMDFNAAGEICKVQSGSSERITFTNQ